MRRFAAGIQAPAELAAPGGAPAWRRARRLLPDWTLTAGPAVTLGMTLWGITARPYWGDEADTVSAVDRSVPQLIRLLGHIDAVHGLYYLLLWPVAWLAGTGELAMRLPSALAMAAAAAGVAAIARRTAGRRAALYAGLVFAVLPAVSMQGQDARPYAAVTAAAVLSSYLLIRAAADPRPRWLAGYGLSLVLAGYLQMFGLLLVAAHLVTLAGLAWRRRPPDGRRWPPERWPSRGWLLTFAAVAVAVAPLLVIGWAQRAAIAWITTPGWAEAGGAVASLAAGSLASVLVLGVLAVPGVLGRPRSWLAPPGPAKGGWAAGGGGRVLGWLAVPWLLLPPAILLAVSQVKPVYNGRYITYCLPAVALLAGAGLAALAPAGAGRGARPGRRAGRAVPAVDARTRRRHADRGPVPAQPRAARRRDHLPGVADPALGPRLPGRLHPAARPQPGAERRGRGPPVRHHRAAAGAGPAGARCPPDLDRADERRRRPGRLPGARIPPRPPVASARIPESLALYETVTREKLPGRGNPGRAPVVLDGRQKGRPMADDPAIGEFERFLAERADALMRSAVLLTGRRDTAQDLLQTALERLLRHWRTLSGDPEAYLRRTLYNLAADGYRRQGRLQRKLMLLRAAAEPEPDPIAEVDLRDAVMRLLLQLPPRQRAVLVLRYWEQLSETETAAVLGWPEGTVKSAASRGLRRMRDLAGSRGDGTLYAPVLAQRSAFGPVREQRT
jgi:mannosyltransferase